MTRSGNASGRALSVLLIAVLAGATVAPSAALAVREGETTVTRSDTDGDGQTDKWEVDWDGDGEVDETWEDTNGDGTVDVVTYTEVPPTHSPRATPGGTWAGEEPLPGGGTSTGIDWDGDGEIDEVWWDFDGDGVIDDTDIMQTESCLVDNTRSRTFRGVFVGVNQDLKYAEDDAKDVKETLEGYTDSWDSGNMDLLTGNAATPAAIQAAIDAAKADSKPGDEFVFYFSGHGGGYDKDDGWSGGVVDHVDTDETDADDNAGDERAVPIPEDELEMDGSDLTTPAAGWLRGHFYDTDGNGTEDTAVVRDSAGNVSVRRFNPDPPPGNWGTVIGTDTDGDGDVDAADGGIDYNNDGDTDDTVYVDDTIEASNGAGGASPITDDQLTQWLSGFPESVTINVILDSCYSGSFIPDLANNLRDADGKPLRPGHLEAIAAAPADDEAWEKPISHGIMTAGLLAALTPVSDPGDPGGHTTTVADLIGNDDDITSTRELFDWAGPAASTYHLGDEDLDGLFDEDGVEHGFDAETRNTTSAVTGDVSASVHTPNNDDGDADTDEDPPVPPDSFFDVYYDPDFDSLPTPTFRQCFGGDQPFSATGMQPGFGMSAELPLYPAPGPIMELLVREVPAPYVASDIPSPPPGLDYASAVWDVTLWNVTATPSIETTDPLLLASAEVTRIETPFGWGPGTIEARIGVGDWVTEGFEPLAAPYFWDEEGTGEWVAYSTYSYDPVGNRIDYDPNHLTKMALFYPGPSRVDTTPPLPITRLMAATDGGDVGLAWSNPTDPDWQSTRVLHSTTGYALGPGDPGFDLVYEGRQPFAMHADAGLGDHYYTVFARDYTGNWTPAKTRKITVSREFVAIQGSDRYATAVAASAEAFPDGLTRNDAEGHRSVVVATGENWPDALGGSTLAGAVDGPILLTRTDSLPGPVATEIRRLGADRVFVVGGTAAVSASVAAALDAVSGVDEVERVWGTDRYATANAVAKRAVALLGSYDGVALVATGLNFPDALAAAPLAAGYQWPLFLTPPATLESRTRTAMQSVGVTDVYVLGGTAAVSGGVEAAIDAMPGIIDVDRLQGSDRYQTAAVIAQTGVENGLGLGWDGVGIATGENFPDALSGGVMLGRRGAVMLLTPATSLAGAAKNKLTANKASIFDVHYLGGTSAVSQTVRNQVNAALQ